MAGNHAGSALRRGRCRRARIAGTFQVDDLQAAVDSLITGGYGLVGAQKVAERSWNDLHSKHRLSGSSGAPALFGIPQCRRFRHRNS